MLKRAVLILFSFLCVAFGTPAWSPVLGLIAAAVGYACFWRVMPEQRKSRFWLAVAWFTAVQLVQYSWLTADDYQGSYIWVCWVLWSAALGLQFGCVSLLIREKMNLLRTLAIPAAWTLMEWVRLFVLGGITWNPAGLALTGALYPMQIVSIAGIFGASFWVMFTNVIFLEKRRLGIVLALFPYLFGWASIAKYDQETPQKTLSVLAVQTILTPIQKQYLGGKVQEVLPPLAQWLQILEQLKPFQDKSVDLIVMPEAVVHYQTLAPVYPIDDVKTLFQYVFGVVNLPDEEEFVGNGFIVQSIADLFDAHVVAGLEYCEEPLNSSAAVYNAAVHFTPHAKRLEMHAKRALLPMAEEIPFEWAKSIAAMYGISGSFTAGNAPTLFSGPVPMAAAVCHEETYSHLLQEARERGAELLISVSNDGWYPHSRLPEQHFYHGRLRAVEEGVPLIRSTTLGVSAVIDHLGRTLAQLDSQQKAVLAVQLPIVHHRTLYSYVGNGLVLSLCVIFLTLFAAENFWMAMQAKRKLKAAV